MYLLTEEVMNVKELILMAEQGNETAIRLLIELVLISPQVKAA